MATHPFLVLAVWWLGVRSSPLPVTPETYYPLATAFLALLTVVLAMRRRQALAGFLPYGSYASIVLALLALFSTKGGAGWSTAMVFLMASVVFAFITVLKEQVLWARVASVTFTVFCLYVADQFERSFSSVIQPRELSPGLAALIAAFCLLGVAGWLKGASREVQKEREDFPKGQKASTSGMGAGR